MPLCSQRPYICQLVPGVAAACFLSTGVPCVQWAYPGVPLKLAQLVKHGHTVAIFNNQGNIRGALTGKVRGRLVPAACPAGRSVPACHALPARRHVRVFVSLPRYVRCVEVLRCNVLERYVSISGPSRCSRSPFKGCCSSSAAALILPALMCVTCAGKQQCAWQG